MIYKKENLFLLSITLFFSIDFLRELFLYIHPNLINVLSISFGLLSIYFIGKVTISNDIKFIYYFLIIFLVLSFLNGINNGFIDKHTIIYSLYKLIEITIVAIIASNLTSEQLIKFYNKFIKLFFIIHLSIFVYYLLVLISILPYYNRIVIFDYRFGGLSGEPAQYGQILLIILFIIFTLNKYSTVKNLKFKLVLFSMLSISSFSNAFSFH